MGWWADEHTAVVSTIIGPGPNALHSFHSFEPDQDWQLDRIGACYADSGRREAYLGDWHSHPNATTGGLSRIDRAVLRRIIKTPAARATTPIMMVLHGTAHDWRIAVWKAFLTKRYRFWGRLDIVGAVLRSY